MHIGTHNKLMNLYTLHTHSKALHNILYINVADEQAQKQSTI